MRKRICICLLAFLAISLFSGLGILFWVCHNQEWVRDKLVQGIEESLSQSCRIGRADIRLTPWPVLSLHELSSKGQINFSIKSAVVIPSMLHLLLGRVLPSYIYLEEPFVHLEKTLVQSSASPAFDAYSIPHGCTLVIDKGAFQGSYGKNRFSLGGLDCYLKTGFSNHVQGDLSIASGIVAMATSTLEFNGLLFLGDVVVQDFFDSDSRFDFQVNMKSGDWLDSLHLQMNVGKEENSWRARLKTRGNLSKDGAFVPFFLEASSSLGESYKSLHIRHAKLGLGERDKATFFGDINFAQKKIAGNLAVEHVSLTEWLGFARMLPPGLQHSLDNISNGNVEFSLDSRGLEVTKASATCAEAYFEGKGGVESWQKPCVFLDMRSKKVDLLKGIPEAAASLPKEPVFSHGPLVGEEDDSPSEIDVQYDIRLGADVLDYGPLKIRNAKVRIHPAPKNASGDQDIVLDANARLCEGNLTGSCVFGGKKETTFAIKVEATEVVGSQLGKVMPVIPIRRGKWNGSASVTSEGTTLNGFLRHLSGQARVECRSGEIALPQSTTLINVTNFQARLSPLRFGQWNGSMLGIDGIWKGSFEQQGLQLQADLTGTMWFGGAANGAKGVVMQSLPARWSVKIDPLLSTLPNPLSLKGQMRLSSQLSPTLLRFSDFSLKTEGAEIRGEGELGRAKDGLALNASVNLSLPDLPSFLSAQRLDFSLSQKLKSLSGDFRLGFAQNKVSLSELNIRTNLGKIGGDIHKDMTKKGLECNLSFFLLNLDRIFPKSENSSQEQTHYDFSALKNWTLFGTMRITELSVKNVHFYKLSIPYRLEKSRLSLKNVEGTLFGGSLHGDATLILQPKIRLESAGVLKAASLGWIAREQMKNGTLNGEANVSAKIKVQFQSMNDWPNCLEGTWSFRTSMGSYQKLNKNKKPVGSPTRFSLLQSSGKISQGIMQSNDIFMKADNLRINGVGELNLNKKTIDCKFSVDKKGMPMFPIYIEGSLDKTKTSFGAGIFILNAIGSIFGGVIDVL